MDVIQLSQRPSNTLAIYHNGWINTSVYLTTGWHYISLTCYPNSTALFHFDGTYILSLNGVNINLPTYSSLNISVGQASGSWNTYMNLQAIRLSDNLLYDTNNYTIPQDINRDSHTIYLFDFSNSTTTDITGDFWYSDTAGTISYDTSLVFNQNYTGSLKLYPGSLKIVGNK